MKKVVLVKLLHIKHQERSDMKSFKQFLREKKESEAPYGVIVDNNRIFVGKGHQKPLILSDDLIQQIKKVGDKYGYWYEGNGGDVTTSAPLPTNKNDYEGSFDRKFEKSVSGEPPEFYYVLFSNIKVNHAIRRVTNPKMSIFDSILDGYNEDGKHSYMYYIREVSPKAETLKKFLKMVSDDEYDFLAMSKMTATKENSKKFLETGEKRMWPAKNWDDYPYNAGKVAQKANSQRDKFLASQKAGVFVVGAGHLIDIVKLNKSFKIIGGEKAY